jgi:hypothetical protein
VVGKQPRWRISQAELRRRWPWAQALPVTVPARYAVPGQASQAHKAQRRPICAAVPLCQPSVKDTRFITLRRGASEPAPQMSRVRWLA